MGWTGLSWFELGLHQSDLHDASVDEVHTIPKLALDDNILPRGHEDLQGVVRE